MWNPSSFMKKMSVTTAAVAILAASAAALGPPASRKAGRVVVPDALVHAFEGVWLGENNPSPFGPISFAMDFQRQADGSLKSHSALSQGTYIQLHLAKSDKGIWLLHDTASLSGLGEMSHTMHPVRVASDTLYFAYLEDPQYLSCELTANATTLHMLVRVRGEEHVRFLLTRQEGEAAAAVRNAMEAARTRAADGDIATLERAGASSDPIEIANARQHTRIQPQDARAHLELANAIAEAIESASPDKMIPYATEMLGSYRRAVELDPKLPDARFGLAQYYLNAPPIAGGSIELAGAEAEALARLDSPFAEIVRAQVEKQQGNAKAAAERLGRLLQKHPDLALARRLYLQYGSNGEAKP